MPRAFRSRRLWSPVLVSPLTSTAIVMQLLEERGDSTSLLAGASLSILLLEDLAIVPLLAFVAFLAPGRAEDGSRSRLALARHRHRRDRGLILAGDYLLDPLFRLLARSRRPRSDDCRCASRRARRGSGHAVRRPLHGHGRLPRWVLLSESTFRHQLEADVEPFRGILLGLFFLGVGMSLDLSVDRRQLEDDAFLGRRVQAG